MKDFCYTIPKLNSAGSGRSLIRFRYQGKEIRVYNGNCMGRPDLEPNRRLGFQRQIEWDELLVVVRKSLDAGWDPLSSGFFSKQLARKSSIAAVIHLACKEKCNQRISQTYQRDLIRFNENFQKFLIKEGINGLKAKAFDASLAHKFLDQFARQSGAYWNSAFANLRALFEFAKVRGWLSENAFDGIKKKANKVKRNEPFSEDLLPYLFEDLNTYDPNLCLMARLIFICFVRPHEEGSRLTRGQFSEDLKELRLYSQHSKSGEQRTVQLNRKTMEQMLILGKDRLKASDNIFTGTSKPFNKYYFNTRWQRFKKQHQSSVFELKEHQSLYSFRVTGVILHYRLNRNLFALRKLLNHKSHQSTEVYLRRYSSDFNSEGLITPDF